MKTPTLFHTHTIMHLHARIHTLESLIFDHYSSGFMRAAEFEQRQQTFWGTNLHNPLYKSFANIFYSTTVIYLHKLKRSLKILHGIHFDPKELHAHNETDDALDHKGTLLLLPEFLQFCDELLPHCLKPEHTHHSYRYTVLKKTSQKNNIFVWCAWKCESDKQNWVLTLTVSGPQWPLHRDQQWCAHCQYWDHNIWWEKYTIFNICLVANVVWLQMLQRYYSPLFVFKVLERQV